MTRRELLAAGAASVSTLWARSRIDKSRISAKWVGMNWDPHNAFGREKSYPGGTLMAAAHKSMDEIMHIVGEI